MRFVLVALLAALAIGFATGGRLHGLSGLRIRWTPLALGGFALQFLTPANPTVAYGLLMLSFVMLTVFAVANLKVAGFTLILAGMLMNFLVIGVNHGMPVTRHALEASGQGALLEDLIQNGGAKHHLATSADRLLILGDVTPLAPPIAQAVSAGDIVAYAGVGYVIVAAMRRDRKRRPSDERGTAQAGAAGAPTP